MADDTTTSRFKPKTPPKKFSWTGNQPGRFRNNGGTANVTGAAGSRPMDASGFEKPLSAGEMGAIDQRYGGGTPGSVSYPLTPAAPPNPNLTTTPAAPPPITTPAATPVPPASDDAVTMLSGDASVPNSTMGEFNSGGDAIGSPGTNPNTGSPMANQKTPEQLAQENQRNWIANGGSLATMHQAQVAQGIRPPIDARATQSPQNSPLAYPDFVQRWAKEKAQARQNLQKAIQPGTAPQ